MPLSLSIVTVNVTRIPSVENRRIFAPYIAVWPAVGPYHPVWGGRVIVERAVVVTASVTGYSIWRVSQCVSPTQSPTIMRRNRIFGF